MSKEERVQVELADSVKLELLGFMACPGTWTGIAHTHSFWELLFLEQGEFSIYFDNGATEVLREKDFFIIRPYERHQFINSHGNSSQLLYLGFSFSLSCEHAPDDLWNHKQINRSPDIRIFKHAFSDLTQRVREQGKEALSAVRPQTVNLLIPLLNWLLAQSSDCIPNTGNSDILCSKVVKYMQDNICRTVTVKEIADSVYLSPHYLGGIFRKHMNMTIKQYQMQMKMQKALTLIKGTDMTMSRVSQHLGFDSSQYFTKCFKSYYGMAPTKLRKC